MPRGIENPTCPRFRGLGGPNRVLLFKKKKDILIRYKELMHECQIKQRLMRRTRRVLHAVGTKSKMSIVWLGGHWSFSSATTSEAIDDDPAG